MSPKRTPLEERLIARIDVRGLEECWPWTGCVDKTTGYGAIGAGGRGGRRLQAHRATYELFVEPIPAGMEPDHLCANRLCQNPDHLDLVTHAENGRRSAMHRWHGTTFWSEN